MIYNDQKLAGLDYIRLAVDPCILHLYFQRKIWKAGFFFWFCCFLFFYFCMFHHIWVQIYRKLLKYATKKKDNLMELFKLLLILMGSTVILYLS